MRVAQERHFSQPANVCKLGEKNFGARIPTGNRVYICRGINFPRVRIETLEPVWSCVMMILPSSSRRSARSKTEVLIVSALVSLLPILICPVVWHSLTSGAVSSLSPTPRDPSHLSRRLRSLHKRLQVPPGIQVRDPREAVPGDEDESTAGREIVTLR